MIPACVKIAPPEVLKMIRSSCVGHHVSHCFVDEQVLECPIQLSVLVMETAYVVMRKLNSILL